MTTDQVSGDQVSRAGRREWLGMAVLALPTMLLSLDVSVLFLALPHLAADLGASSTQQLWITDIYGFMTAGLLVTMGTVGDRIGRRRLLLGGAAAFGLASTLAAVSTSPGMLIAARAMMGVAGSTLLPSILALLGAMFTDPRQRSVAIAVWMTSFMGGIALGPVVGGVLLENFWWGSVFLMGAPVMGLLLVAGPVLLPDDHARKAGRLDLTSVALSLAAILPVIYGLKEIARHGWQPAPAVAIAVGVAFGAVFVVRQRGLADPLLDLRLFGARSFSAALVVGLLVGSLQSGTALLVALHLQTVEGLSPVRAGLWLVPPALALVLGINLTPALARRVRPAGVLAVGMGVSAVGQLLLTRVGSTGGLTMLVVGLGIVYVGVGPAAALISQLVLETASPDKAGSAASMSATSGEFGVALGIAALGSVGAAVYRAQVVVPAGVPAGAAGSAHESIAGAVSAATRLRPPLGDELLRPAREAFTAGLHTVAGLSAVLFVGLAILAAVALGHVRPIGQAQPGQAQPAHAEPEPDGEAGLVEEEGQVGTVRSVRTAAPGADHDLAEAPGRPVGPESAE